MKPDIFFTWNITYNCSYSCSYCHAPKPDSMDTRKISVEEWEDIWKRIYERYGRADMIISGGDPFVYPDFMKILEAVTKWHIVEVCTNLAWDTEYFIKNMDPEKVRVGTSFHPEFTGLEDFLAKIKNLNKAGFETFVNFVPWPPFLDRMKDFKRRIEEAGTKFILQPFIGDWDGRRYPEGYTEKELAYFDDEILEDEANRSIMSFKTEKKLEENNNEDEKQKSSKGGPVICNMGRVYGYILPDGSVRRCCSDETEMLGNIIDGSFKFYEEAMECRSSHCHCARRMVVGEEKRWKERWGRDR